MSKFHNITETVRDFGRYHKVPDGDIAELLLEINSNLEWDDLQSEVPFGLDKEQYDKWAKAERSQALKYIKGE